MLRCDSCHPEGAACSPPPHLWASKAFGADVVICPRAGHHLAFRAAVTENPCQVRKEFERTGEMCLPAGGSSHFHKPALFGFGNPVKHSTAFVAVVFHSSDLGGNC